jgi:glycosyltransferase involved in cell wall biosynthesis
MPIFKNELCKIQSYQREITAKNIEFTLRLGVKNMAFTGCSQNLINRVNPQGYWKGIHNCVVFKKYKLNAELNYAEAPLIFLGRIERIKGCHTAIEVAKASNKKLIIAGNISKLPEEILYFNTKIKPHIDGDIVKFVGEVNDSEKNHWLGIAGALLMPIEWNEPFGIVMIEAMACGTPVIAFPFGSVPEVVNEGLTGFIVADKKGMIDAVGKVHSIDRKRCREIAEKSFDVSVIVQEYLNLFPAHIKSN